MPQMTKAALEAENSSLATAAKNAQRTLSQVRDENALLRQKVQTLAEEVVSLRTRAIQLDSRLSERRALTEELGRLMLNAAPSGADGSDRSHDTA